MKTVTIQANLPMEDTAEDISIIVEAIKGIKVIKAIKVLKELIVLTTDTEEVMVINKTITKTITMGIKHMTRMSHRTHVIGGITCEKISLKAWSPKANGTAAGRISSRVSTAVIRLTV
jgi:hypothetical protein